MFSVALVFIDQWLKSHPNLKAQCLYEISLCSLIKKMEKNNNNTGTYSSGSLFPINLKTK